MASVIMKERHIKGRPAIVCPECGELIAEADKAIKLKLPYCGNCNRGIDDAQQKYCGHCGEPLNWGKVE